MYSKTEENHLQTTDQPPPYISSENDHVPNLVPSLSLANRPRALSAQPRTTPSETRTSLSSLFRTRGASATPVTSSTRQETVETVPPDLHQSLYPSIEEPDYNRSREPSVAKTETVTCPIEIKELWEAGLGVHTGMFKSLRRMSDVGGETPWRKGAFEWIPTQQLVQVRLAAGGKPIHVGIKHSAINQDKNSLGRPYTLSIHTVGGKTFKIAFPDAILMNDWLRIWESGPTKEY